jgi:cation/acetate symporter
MYLMGWTGGYVLLALLLAPYLRKFGQYTVPDFVGTRYASSTARIVAACCAIFVSLTYVAGQMKGVGVVFSRFLDVPLEGGVVIGMCIVAFFAVLGGMKGITWTQVMQYFVLIVAFLIPAFFIARMVTNGDHSVPQSAFLFSDLAERLNQIQIDLGFEEYTKPFTSHSRLNVLCITAALMFGTAGLPHVIVRFYTVPSVRAARWSAFWALFFIAILYTAAPAVGMFARYNLLESLNGAQIVETEVQPAGDDGVERSLYRLEAKLNERTGKRPDLKWAYNWQKTGLLSFDDMDESGTISLAKTSTEATIDKDIIVLSTPEVAGLPAWVIALVAAGGLAAALSTAAGLLLVISSSMAHDLYVQFVDPEASEAKKVMIGRIMILIAICVAGWFGIHPPGFVAETVAFAFGLAAASFFPAILLGIFDSRTNRQGAVSGMLVGIAFTAFYIVGNQWDTIFGMERAADFVRPWYMTRWFFEISPQGIGTIGMLLNFAVALVVSRLTPPPPAEVRELVARIRSAG